MSRWTRFMDMHSGGTTKENFEYLYIEEGEKEAKRIFISTFGHDPEDVACQCCGQNYSFYEHDSLAEATAYDRGCKPAKVDGEWIMVEEADPNGWRPYLTIEEYLIIPGVRVMYKKDIPAEMRAS